MESFFPASYRQDAPVEGSRRLQEAVRRVRGDDPPPPPPPPPPPASSGGGAAAEQADLNGLMDDGLDELLAGVEEPNGGDQQGRVGDGDGDGDGLGGLEEWDDADGVDGFEDVSRVEESSTLPDVVPKPRSAPRASTGRAGRARSSARGRGRGRGRARKPASIFTDDDPQSSSSAAPTPMVRPSQHEPAPRASSVPAELASLDPVSRERVLLVRRLRDRANLVRSQIQHDNPATASPAQQKPSTREVRARMMDTLLKQNPRLRLEREAQLRRRLGLPVNPAGRGRSCRDPGARREASFSEALAEADERQQPETAAEAAVTAEGSGDSAAPAPDAPVPTAAEPSAAPGPESGTVSAPTASVAAAAPAAAVDGQPRAVTSSSSAAAAAAAAGTAAVVESSRPSPAAAGRSTTGRRPSSGSASARRQSAADRLRQAAAAPDRPLPVLPAPAAAEEEAPQRQMSERRQAEARRHAAELLRAAGGPKGRRRTQKAAGRRQQAVQRPRPGPRAGGLSESSDSD